MNSGHNQTEPVRVGVLHGPYALLFTDGSAPQQPVDYSWIGRDLNLLGWLSERGFVRGKATGIPQGFESVVSFANATSQGWCRVNPATGESSPALKPGDYTMTLYKGELAVAFQPVTVLASPLPLLKNIVSAEVAPPSVWRIGEWDGTPKEFLNAENITIMHPSDVRESKWAPVTFEIGTSKTGIFPSEQWKDVNSPTAIRFALAPGQVAPMTLRVGITAAYAGARPQVQVNSWNAPLPQASVQPKSRSLTLGTYWGNNTTFAFDIPPGVLVAGTNTVSISVVGRSNFSGFLSPGYAYDCVELDSAAPAQALAPATR